MSFTSLPSKSNSKKISAETETTTVLENVSIYNQLDANSFVLPSFESFNLALSGFNLLKDKGLVQKNILTLVDFSLSSNKKRLWVIDLDKKIILFQTLVAHGRNTGEEFAKQFSNQAESFQSSVGFYATGEIYDGKHGMSLKLDGLEKGLNDKARERAVVVHGADYVSESFIKQNKRLGRSQGCPALPVEMNAKIINVIKDKSCLFIYHPSAANEIMSRLAS
ncbi:murein L,D-transpeptidase catalytic domain family protein [Flavobacterium sangjuense]|nr:murein L,D-transpeptidase catalytic domain family protein [Flavobacterium sangjuense]